MLAALEMEQSIADSNENSWLWDCTGMLSHFLIKQQARHLGNAEYTEMCNAFLFCKGEFQLRPFCTQRINALKQHFAIQRLLVSACQLKFFIFNNFTWFHCLTSHNIEQHYSYLFMKKQFLCFSPLIFSRRKCCYQPAADSNNLTLTL